MNQSTIFAPVFAMMMLTGIVWAYMYYKRIPFIMRNKFIDDQLSPLEFAKLSPPEISNPSDNLKNLFEIPMLFYVLALYLFVTNHVDNIYLIASWVFVGFRVLHSAVHCTINMVIVRFWLYLLATISVVFIACRAGLQYLGY